MAIRDHTQNQGGQSQGGNPKQGAGQKGGQQSGAEYGGGKDRGRKSEGGDKEAARPSPSGVPNEGRRTEGQDRNLDEVGREADGGYEYKGGRQGQGGVPNPDDQDDSESPGSFRGTADQEPGADDDEGEQDLRVGQKRDSHVNTQIREPNEDRDQRRVESSDDETRNPV